MKTLSMYCDFYMQKIAWLIDYFPGRNDAVHVFFPRQIKEVTFHFNQRGSIVTYGLAETKMLLFFKTPWVLSSFDPFRLNYDVVIQGAFLVHPHC